MDRIGITCDLKPIFISIYPDNFDFCYSICERVLNQESKYQGYKIIEIGKEKFCRKSLEKVFSHQQDSEIRISIPKFVENNDTFYELIKKVYSDCSSNTSFSLPINKYPVEEIKNDLFNFIFRINEKEIFVTNPEIKFFIDNQNYQDINNLSAQIMSLLINLEESEYPLAHFYSLLSGGSGSINTNFLNY